ncbi:SWI/SNF related-matrix-associated actin-dependent regulator of chromatin subfamily C [Pancytospora epiphaga]|nr:SWI/SNF related-matrix-associated actin-dependent regulator of chromatin subfamily C [Pancytospora epiphaga]
MKLHFRAPMLNVFPRAEKAPIEQTIGYQRQSAHPPEDQPCKEPNIPQQYPGFKPFCCRPKWFENSTISPYEKSIFDTEDYLKIRNGIMNIHLSGSGYVTLGMCRHLGSLPTLIRVFDFLEDNNLINYEVELKADTITVQNTMQTNSALINERNLSEKPSSCDSSERQPAVSQDGNTDVCGGTHSKQKQEKVKTRYVSREMLQQSKCSCGNISQYFTSDLLFICDECLGNESYPTSYTPRNFHRITASLLQCLWTKREEFELLRNIEMYGDDWDKVSGTLNKTPDQCIFHFIKMSLFDECETFPSMCFSTVPNQISTFIAYVAYMVHPSISAELAKNAMKYLDRGNHLIEILLSVAVHKAKEVLALEREKYARLIRVGHEAHVRKILLKLEALCEMCNETNTVRGELEVEREKLMEELIRDRNK